MKKNTESAIQWQENEALKRFQMIAPFMAEDMDSAKKNQLREQAASQNNISVRTLYRYEKAYRENGFPGLKPQNRSLLIWTSCWQSERCPRENWRSALALRKPISLF